MILKIFNLKRGNRDRKTSDTSFMKKEHEQVAITIPVHFTSYAPVIDALRYQLSCATTTYQTFEQHV